MTHRGAVVGLLRVVAALLLVVRVAAAQPEVAMFDPDANLANVARLRTTMTSLLRMIDPRARFIPFTRLADLERHLANNHVQFLIIDPVTAARLGLRVRPILVPARGEDTTHRKILLVRTGTRVSDLKVVATTASPDEVQALDIPGRGTRPLRVLRVTKSFDALLGLAFQRADAAYVTPETFAELARVESTIASGLREIYRSPPIPNAPLVAVTAEVDEVMIKRVTDLFATMDRTDTGRSVLRLLDYTGWRAP